MPVLAHAAAPISGRWRLALMASVGLWLLIGSAIGVFVSP